MALAVFVRLTNEAGLDAPLDLESPPAHRPPTQTPWITLVDLCLAPWVDRSPHLSTVDLWTDKEARAGRVANEKASSRGAGAH